MTKTLIPAFAVIACLLISVLPAVAHHGRGATYDMKQMKELKGTVSEVIWRNPHIAIFMDVKDETGNVTKWAIEHSNITTLSMLGYSRTTLKPGMEVTAYVRPGAKGQPIGLCMKIVLPDGKEIFERRVGVD
jgi:hypothetical protein